MCLNETCSTVFIDKNTSDKFPIQNGLKQQRCFITILFNFALEYAIGLKLNGTHEHLAYSDDINIVGENRYHTEKHRSFIRH
jgi:hypothetical protein